MSNPVIRVQGLGKRYVLSHQQSSSPRYQRFSEVILDTIKSPFRRLAGSNSRQSEIIREDFWALKDVSFDVPSGEVIGIIGRNGAGKSTLLKLLSRITEPTAGRIEIEGRIASLLEVGTGFHPELTGRENVFLNGAILGMGRSEIRLKFDEIVAFAEVERFLDTPVKFYSSGMYVRLAFAVAAHLEPEILIIDEVLAVGDMQFQKKCIGKMGEVARSGRTVLLVSHNTGVLANLCTHAVMLARGQVAMQGAPADVIEAYIRSGSDSRAEATWPDTAAAPGNDKLRLHAVRVRSQGEVSSDISIDHDCEIEIDYWNLSPGLLVMVSLHLLDKMGGEVLATANMRSANLIEDRWFGRPFEKGLYRSVCTLPANFLNEGMYSIRVALCSNVTKVELLTKEVISFTVHDSGEMRKEFGSSWLGVVRPRLAWQTERMSAA